MLASQRGKLVKRESSDEILREARAHIGENSVRNARKDKDELSY